MSKVLVIGGGGYVGSALCPALVSQGHEVTAYDTFWYGTHVLSHAVNKIKADIRNVDSLRSAMIGMDAVIHLACISNDPSFDLDPDLGRAINLDCFPVICEVVRDSKVKRFIYASSSSVYGIHEGYVNEKTTCNPLTDYSKFKYECEKYLRIANMGDTMWTIVRPATICGAAPRVRLDLIVNVLTAHALENRVITVHGGNQMRPNLHIDDMVRAYGIILKASPYQVSRQTFNIGGENLTVTAIAHRVSSAIGDKQLKIETAPVNDPRSYHISSSYADRMLGWCPKHSVEDAVQGLMKIFPYLKDPLNNSQYHNIKKMKELAIA